MNRQVNKRLIKEFREAMMLTQEALAEAARVNPRTIQRMEGEGVASSKTITAVAHVLEVDPDELYLVSKWEKLRNAFLKSWHENDEDSDTAASEISFLVFVLCMLLLGGFAYFHSVRTETAMEEAMWAAFIWGVIPSMLISGSVASLFSKKRQKGDNDQ